MSITYKVKGLGQFERMVRQKGRRAQAAVESELNRSSLRVERKAKIYAPWDTGWMSNSIYSMYQDVLKYVVVSPAEYSIFVEKGTRKMMAQPFVHPALQEEAPILMKRLSKMFGK
ncbi:HK97-gp10 family putative phage morphogenesis protein [Streptococcus hyovaginalis]|uniref:HK97-gp10 family putative phage morphogenesis protein n=1 Tax=Streptococcus hyovaginalis TaxID=149015 RepID=UPI003AE1119B